MNLQVIKENCNIFFKTKNYICSLQMFGCSFLLIMICIWQVLGCNTLSLIFFFLGILCLFVSSLMAICHNNVDTQFRRNTVLLIVMGILSITYICINAGVIMTVISKLKFCIIISGLLCLVVVQAFQICLVKAKRKWDKKNWLEFGLVTGIAIIWGFLLNIECFNTWPRWDSYSYFHSFEQLSARNIFLSGNEGLVVCAHNSASYCIWALLFRMIPGISNLNAMYLSNMSLIAVDAVLLYLIFKHLLFENKVFQNVLCMLLLVSSPWILGHAADLSIEYMLLTGVLLLLYSIFCSNQMLGIIGVFTTLFAKEYGILIAAAIVFVQLLYDDTMDKKNINFSYYILNVIQGWLCLVLFLRGNWGKTNALMIDGSLLDGSPILTFGFSWMHIKDVLTDGFIINFNWVFLLMLVCTIMYIVVLIIKKKKQNIFFVFNRNYLLLVVTCATCIGVMCVYIIGRIYRYYITSSVILGILALCGIQYVWRNIKVSVIWQNVILVVLCGIMFVDSYRFIDPISVAIYPEIDTGENLMVFLPQHTSVDKDNGMPEMVNSNRQIMYFDKALDKAYAAIYKESSMEEAKILCSGEYVTRIENGKVTLGSLYNIWGFGYAYLDPPMWGEWDSKGKYRYLSHQQPIKLIDPEYVIADTDLSSYINEYEHVYYIKMPWGDTVLEKLQEKYSSISGMETIKYRGWVLEIYRIK